MDTDSLQHVGNSSYLGDICLYPDLVFSSWLFISINQTLHGFMGSVCPEGSLLTALLHCSSLDMKGKERSSAP